jgi:hypothetical protein
MVLMTAGGCFPFPVTKHRGTKPGAIEAGETTRAHFGNPKAKTSDGRFFLYRFDRTTEWWLWFGATPVPLEDPLATTHGSGQVLVEFDTNDVVKRRVVHRCEKRAADPICEESSRHAMWAMIKELLGADRTAQYAARIGSLGELLTRAIEYSDLEEINRLIRYGADVHQAAPEGYTPLHTAAQQGYTAVAELLIAQGADVNVLDSSDARTPLHAAATAGHTAVVELLLAKGAEVNAKMKGNSQTPLHVAAGAGHADVVALLIAQGADLNAVTLSGRTPLHQAAQHGHSGAVEVLLAQGAQVNAKDKYGGTPMRALSGYQYLGYPDQREEIVELLKRYGAKE